MYAVGRYEVVMNCFLLTPTFTVTEVLRRWPQSARVFFEYRTACVGCTMAPFDTLADVAASYGIDLDAFLEALYRTIHATDTDE